MNNNIQNYLQTFCQAQAIVIWPEEWETGSLSSSEPPSALPFSSAEHGRALEAMHDKKAPHSNEEAILIAVNS